MFAHRNINIKHPRQLTVLKQIDKLPIIIIIAHELSCLLAMITVTV